MSFFLRKDTFNFKNIFPIINYISLYFLKYHSHIKKSFKHHIMLTLQRFTQNHVELRAYHIKTCFTSNSSFTKLIPMVYG